MLRTGLCFTLTLVLSLSLQLKRSPAQELGSQELGSQELGSQELWYGELGDGELWDGELGDGELGDGGFWPQEPGPTRLPPVADEFVRPAFAIQELEEPPLLDEIDELAPAILPVWTVGSLRIKPYGFFWADMVFASQRTNPGAFSLFVFSQDEHTEAAFSIDARRTRFGLEVEGPAWNGLRTSGRAEIDFHGNFVFENRASILLRHAYWELQDEQVRFLVGQTDDVVSPLQPRLVDYAPAYLAGNIGFRRTQFRAERRVAVGERHFVEFQGSLNQDIVPDFASEQGVRREPAGWPVVEGRWGWRSSRDANAARFGISGHVGETGFDFLEQGPPPLNLPPERNVRVPTWSANLDLYLPLTERIGVQGELFTGSNLSAYLGGIGQGVCPCLRRPIRSHGGWVELWYEWSPSVRSHAGFAVDDPRDSDSLLGRTYNDLIFLNLIANLTEQITTGFEVTYRKTFYHETRVGMIPPNQLTPSAPGRAITLDWMVRYGF